MRKMRRIRIGWPIKCTFDSCALQHNHRHSLHRRNNTHAVAFVDVTVGVILAVVVDVRVLDLLLVVVRLWLSLLMWSLSLYTMHHSYNRVQNTDKEISIR